MKKEYKQKKCKMCGEIFKPLSGSSTMCGNQKKKIGCAYKNRLAISRRAFVKYFRKNKDEFNARRKVKREANPKLFKAQQMWQRFKITPKQYQILLKKQKYKCAICQTKLSSPYIDHCHKTKKVRGILCQGCNSGIGFLKDSITNLKMAIKYLNGK